MLLLGGACHLAIANAPSFPRLGFLLIFAIASWTYKPAHTCALLSFPRMRTFSVSFPSLYSKLQNCDSFLFPHFWG